MPSSYLKKFNDEFNPVNERLELKKKLIIRIVVMTISVIAFIILRITNVHNVFTDISHYLVVFVYSVIGVSSVISLIGIILILFSLIFQKGSKKVFSKIPFKTKKFVFSTLDWLIYVPLCICFALYLYAFAFRVQLVSGPSMEESFYNGDRVISIYDEDIKRGDVVIAKLNTVKNLYAKQEEYIIKRVIGVPGDTITYTRAGLFINGQYISEDYITDLPLVGDEFDGNFKIYKEDPNNPGSRIEEIYTVIPEGYYFVLGDNRDNSNDSRDFGLFSQEDIVSIVVVRFSGFKISFVERGVLE